MFTISSIFENPMILVALGFCLLSLIISIVNLYNKHKKQKQFESQLNDVSAELQSFYATMKKYKNISLAVGFVALVAAMAATPLMFFLGEGFATTVVMFLSAIVLCFAVAMVYRGLYLDRCMKSVQSIQKQLDSYNSKGITLQVSQTRFLITAIVVSVIGAIILTVVLNFDGCGSAKDGPCSACGGDGLFFGEICDACGGWG